MKFKIALLAFLISVSGLRLFAQNSTSSPYSGFGIGELEMSSGGQNAGMGNTGIALRSHLFLNTSNPASLTTIKPQSFLFDLGMNIKYTQLENATKSVNVNDGNLSWLQMGFPITKKFFGGLSLNPKSSVGYNIFTAKSIDGTTYSYPAIYEGTGGLSEAAGLLAWKLSNNISFGAKAGYIWGNVSQELQQSITVSNITYLISQEDKIHYSGGYFNLGTQISLPISAKSGLVLGSVAGISSRLNSTITTSITKTYESTSETVSSDVKTSGSMRLPLDLGFGISYLYGQKWVGTFDYKRSNWEDATLRITSYKLSINNSYRAGLEFAPKNDDKFLRQSVRYRLGYRYESGYLTLYNNQIHEQAFTIGLGLPIKKDRSYANFSLELGMRGTKVAHLVEEKYIKLNCSFNLWDRWFVKRQFE
ncbi:MAG: hypothetical protein WC384_21070 [Prolixibacteraceae bacterium]|jgi:hypothetical protein